MYLTEITGELFNIGIGEVSLISFRIVWVFYGTAVVLLALSGYRWGEPASPSQTAINFDGAG